MTGAAGMMPELGSKISLISKADIRYEGRLFTVDPQECTIALANVRSFGTEDRETPYPIAPQPTVYDYILFRGSDIKDIRVVNNVAIPNDPAIMQMHLPPNQLSQQQQGFPPQGFPMQPQQGVPSLNQFGPFGGNLTIGGGPNIQPSQPQQQAQSSPNQSQQQTQSNQQQQGNTINKNLTPNGQTKKSNSRSGTPNMSRKSPTSDMGVQTNQNQREGNVGGGNREKTQRNNQRNNQHRDRRDSGRNEMFDKREGGYRNQRQQMQPQRGGYNNRNNNQMQGMRGNQQGGSGRMRIPQNYYRQNQNKQQQNGGPPRGKNQNTLKFENEFDFEQANSKFEELRSQLAKLKVGTEEVKSTEQVNGEVEKKDDSGNETGADHEAETEDTIGYDKNKSFFDNISCEANERSKGKSQRPDWRQERKINSETFGLSMNRRGNMRGGRGYYRNTYNNRPMNNYRSGPPQNRNYNNRNRNVQNSNNNGRINTNQQSQQSQPVAAAN